MIQRHNSLGIGFCTFLLGGCFIFIGGCSGPDNPSKEEIGKIAKADWAKDFCMEYGWYGDGVCDDFCPTPDPDCDCKRTRDCQRGTYCALKEESAQGSCLAFGSCLLDSDCFNSENQWSHPEGFGLVPFCDLGKCQLRHIPIEPCLGVSPGNGGEGEPCFAAEQCDGQQYCNLTLCVCYPPSECSQGSDCQNPTNHWSHEDCPGQAQCQDGLCLWICS